jgi:HJR/Mrr/RecB family endonuclease
MKYRSGWECVFACLLDNDPTVKSYSYESIVIPYMSNKTTRKVRRYFPDFFITYVDGSRVLVEIKPRRKLVQRTVIKKLEAAKLWCSCNDVTLSVITEVELKEYELSQKEASELTSI